MVAHLPVVFSTKICYNDLKFQMINLMQVTYLCAKITNPFYSDIAMHGHSDSLSNLHFKVKGQSSSIVQPSECIWRHPKSFMQTS